MMNKDIHAETQHSWTQQDTKAGKVSTNSNLRHSAQIADQLQIANSPNRNDHVNFVTLSIF